LDKYEIFMQRIVCGKFDKKIDIDTAAKLKATNRTRIGSINPKKLSVPNFSPVSTNGTLILAQGKIFGVREFLSKQVSSIDTRLIVLTRRERSQILDELLDFEIDVSVFEEKYPIFEVRYRNDMHENLSELERLLAKIAQLEIRGRSLAHSVTTSHRFKIERKLRLKNNLDAYFSFANTTPYQEVFRLKETREDRSIIAFDFNSMFAACMSGEFVEPKHVEYREFRGENSDVLNLPDGLFHVLLKRPKASFFTDFHPFNFSRLRNSHKFKLESEQEVEILLMRNELVAYQEHFYEVEILAGLCSDKTVRHPLYQYALGLYKERLNFRERGNQLLERFCKFKLVTMHSASRPRRYKEKVFESKGDFVNEISKVFMLDLSSSTKLEELLPLFEDYNFFEFESCEEGYRAKVPDITNKDAVYSLSAQILANARLKMLKTIELFLLYNSVEICYVNIDSLHVSILKSEVDPFLRKHEALISPRLGDLKIQTIADKGYWFDVGRYWLFAKDEVVQFKNSFFNNPSSKTPFVKSRRVKYTVKSPEIDYIKTVFASIENSFSYKKKIDKNGSVDTWNYQRYAYSEVKNLEVAGDSMNNEILRSKRDKIDLFNEIATG